MFNKQNFCHVASNNRNEKKAGIFVYKTTDDLATVTTNGYFNEKIIDINLHDLIIHEWHNPADRTKVQKNVLCVTERTLDNVGTTLIKSKWEADTDQIVATLQEQVGQIVGNYVTLTTEQTITGKKRFEREIETKSTITIENTGSIRFHKLTGDVYYPVLRYADPNIEVGTKLAPIKILGNNARPLYNDNSTIALLADVDLAANSGRMITDQGLWYAKMDSATVAPAAENGTNYADFSQVDGQGNPIIVTYTRTNGAWVQDQTITPPAEYDGYVPITSKIWDIPEQAGQQGGRILWNHQSKEFTPYPQIISFENASLTGVSTAPTPTSSSPTNQIVNKDYVDSAVAASETGYNIGDIFFTMRPDNELNGAVECDGATYQTTDFTGAQSIGALLEANKVAYVSLSEYEWLLQNNGSVSQFGWDGTGTTAFRVPKLDTNIFIQSRKNGGDFYGIYQPGLPNIKATNGTNISDTGVPTGAFVRGNLISTNGGGQGQIYEMGFDASQYSSVYKNNVNTVQPYAVRYRLMVQLAISATDEALETCTGVLADVANLKDHRVIAFQAPTAENNYTWYRKYADGWVEMGGHITPQDNNAISITYPVSLTTAKIPTVDTSSNYTGDIFIYVQQVLTISTTGFTCRGKAIGTNGISAWENHSFDWTVCGMAA